MNKTVIHRQAKIMSITFWNMEHFLLQNHFEKNAHIEFRPIIIVKTLCLKDVLILISTSMRVGHNVERKAI